MEDLNSLSNEELKYRLTQFGYPNVPVTSTTRKVLIKKLRNHMDNEKSKLKRETSYATRYSSDEDQSDVDKPAAAKKRAASSRATVGAISPRSTSAAATRSTMPPPAPARTESKVSAPVPLLMRSEWILWFSRFLNLHVLRIATGWSWKTEQFNLCVTRNTVRHRRGFRCECER